MKRKGWLRSGFARAALAGLLGASGSVLAQGSMAPATADVFVDGTPAASWRVNGTVYATEIVGDTVFVGGTFTTATSPDGQNVARRNLAAFSMTTGTLRTDWRADAGSSVRAIESDGTSIYVGGSFGRVDGQTRQRLAKVSVSTGAVDPVFRPALNDTVRAIAVDSSGVYIGGMFTTVNGVARQRIAKLSSSGNLDTQFNARANHNVWGLAKAASSSVVYVSGPFTTLNGNSRNGVGGLNANTGATSGPSFGNAASPTLGLAANDDGSLLFGAGGTWRNAVSAWNTGSGSRLWTHMAMGDIQAVEYFQGTVYFGFHDGYGGNTQLKVLAADAHTGALDADFRPRFNRFWGVMAIAVSPLGVVVGGDFTSVSGVAAQGWARFRGTAPAPEPDPEPDPPTAGDVHTFSATDDATIMESEPSANFGVSGRLLVDRSPDPAHSLIRFDVSGLGGQSVQRAVLRLHTLDRSDRGGTVTSTEATWNEQAVTWATAPAAGTPVGTLPAVEVGNWYEVDVTSLVSGDGPVSLRITPQSDNGADYASSESNGFGPTLEVTVGQ